MASSKFGTAFRASGKRSDSFIISNGMESLVCTRFKNSAGSYDYQFTGMRITSMDIQLKTDQQLYEMLEEFVMDELNYPAELTMIHNNCMSSERFDKVIGSVSGTDEWVTLPTDHILLAILECMSVTDKRVREGKTSVYVGKKRSGVLGVGDKGKDKFRF